MTIPDPDERIRERFRRLRSDAETAGAPEFRAMLDRARAEAAVGPLEERRAVRFGRRRGIWRAAGVAGAAAAAALAAVLLTRGSPDRDAEFERLVASYASDPAGGAWSSPTDALLEVPGSQLIRSLPSVDGGLGVGEEGRL